MASALPVCVFYMLRTSHAPLILHTVRHSFSQQDLPSWKRTLSLGNRICKKVSHLWKLLFFSFPHLHTSENACFSTHWCHDRWATIKSSTEPCADGSAETLIKETENTKLEVLSFLTLIKGIDQLFKIWQRLGQVVTSATSQVFESKVQLYKRFFSVAMVFQNFLK